MEKLQPVLVKKLGSGEADLRMLVAAAALANAETFGGHDYVGYHTEMALLPALQMSAEMPSERRALPVLKVLYRNTERIQNAGWQERRVLKPVSPEGFPRGEAGGELLREAMREADLEHAERLLKAQAEMSLADAYNYLLWMIEDDAGRPPLRAGPPAPSP